MNKLNFDDIKLPNEDGSKPADVDLNTQSDTGDEGSVTQQDAQPVKKTDAELEAEQAAALAKETKTEDAKAEDAKATDATTDKPKEDAAPADEKLTPFHQHPDWKKMQDENQKLREEVARTQGQVDTLLKTGQTTTAEVAAVVKSAEERIQEDIKNGWEPKDQLELALRVSKYTKEELKAQQEADTKAKQEADKTNSDQLQKVRSEFETNMNTAFTELKVADLPTQEKIAKKIQDLIGEGVIAANPKGIAGAVRYAYRELVAAGELQTTTTTPEKTEADKAKEAEAAKKTQVNGKITKPTATGEAASNDTKVVIPNAHKMDLDKLTMELGKQM